MIDLDADGNTIVLVSNLRPEPFDFLFVRIIGQRQIVDEVAITVGVYPDQIFYRVPQNPHADGDSTRVGLMRSAQNEFLVVDPESIRSPSRHNPGASSKGQLAILRRLWRSERYPRIIGFWCGYTDSVNNLGNQTP